VSHQWVKSACQRSPALFGGEADVGGFGSFVGAGFYEAGVEAFAGELGAQGDDEVDGGLG